MVVPKSELKCFNQATAPLLTKRINIFCLFFNLFDELMSKKQREFEFEFDCRISEYFTQTNCYIVCQQHNQLQHVLFMLLLCRNNDAIDLGIITIINYTCSIIKLKRAHHLFCCCFHFIRHASKRNVNCHRLLRFNRLTCLLK